MLIFIVVVLVYQQCMRVPFPPISSPAFVVFLMTANLTKARWNLTVVFICISMCLLAICISSSENYLFNSFAFVLIGLFVLWLFRAFLNSLYILDINSYLLNNHWRFSPILWVVS
jgi:hypothetical protein